MIFTWFIYFQVTFTWYIFTCNFFSQFLYFHVIFFTIQVNFTRLIFTLFFTVNLFFTRLFSWFLHNSLFSYMTFTQFISFRTWYLHYSFIFYTTNSFRLSFRFTINFHMMFLHDNTFHVFFFFTWLIKLNSFDTVLIYFCIHFQREACGFIFHIHDSFLSVLFKWCYLSSRCFSPRDPYDYDSKIICEKNIIVIFL